VSNILKIPIIQDAHLHERDWGIFTGRLWHEVEQLLETMTLKERYAFVPLGGESWEMFETRISKAVDQIVGEMMHGTTVFIITHGGVIRALLSSLLKLPKETSFNYKIINGSLTFLHYTARGYQLVLINNTDNLALDA
jgi:broad specificity phosphatase PhoE